MVCRSSHICQINVLDYEDEFDESSIMVFKKNKDTLKTEGNKHRQSGTASRGSIVHHFR